MSGGVDSSVSALLLKKQGYDVVGMTMQVWDYSQSEDLVQEGYGTCCSSLDVEDARSVCQKLNIPFYVLNCEARFKSQVIDKFTSSYLRGETPVPCLDCNSYLKFDLLVKKMKELECGYLATGHYAQIKKTSGGRYVICQSRDDWKDQTYFLFTISPHLLPKILFPVGSMDKQSVRTLAKKEGLLVSDKKDSTGLCFVAGPGGYKEFIKKEFLKKNLKPKGGMIKKYPSGEILGRHEGLYQFTYGQRKGLNVSFKNPLYVIKIDTKNSVLWLGEEEHLYSKKASLSNIHFLDSVKEGERLKVKVRFHHPGSWTRVYKTDENSCELKFEAPEKAVTPGQAAVLYRGNQLVGGGSIVDFS